MSWAWTNITFRVTEPQKRIEEASSRPRTREQVIYDFTKEEWSEENIPQHDYITIMFGDVKLDILEEKYIKKYFEKFDFIDKAAAIYVTDDTYQGWGNVYENNNGEINLLEEYAGYQRARGFDVQGMISEDFHIRPTAEKHW